MNYLLYSSKEMFSSTELVRKNKMIFNKLIKKDIEKAIILRDGKPSFVILEFNNYEEMMSEFMMLKDDFNTDLNTQNNININKDNKQEFKEIKPLKEVDTQENFMEDEEENDIDYEEYIDEDLAEIDDYAIERDETILDEFLDIKKENSDNENQKIEDDLNNTITIDEDIKSEDINKNEQIDNNDNSNNEDDIDMESLSDEERMELLKKEEEELQKTLQALEKLNIGKKDA